VDIYRKPTSTDTTVNFLSNQPIGQKMAVFRFYITRMHSLPLNPDNKQKEWETIQSIAKNNNFPQHLLQNLTNGYITRVITLATRRNTKFGPRSHIIAPK
jgi:hypothetical protein